MLVLERASGDLLKYEIAVNRFTTHLHVLCSIPSHRVMLAYADGELNLERLAPPGFIPCWCLSQKGMVFEMIKWQDIEKLALEPREIASLYSAIENAIIYGPYTDDVYHDALSAVTDMMEHHTKKLYELVNKETA